jgi:glycosyltransferase involved in cell wall biosynthesis
MDLQATVIIPTYEDWGILQICLDCLARQSVAPEIFEVIVANNNPSPDLPASLRLPVNARVIHVRKPGSYAARNAAIHEARADVLFFTDSDCQPDSRWIEAGLAAIAPLGPHDRVAGAVALFPKGEQWTGTELFDCTSHMVQEEFARNGWCVTANLVVRRAAFDFVGLFDDDRYSGGDRAWNLRATELGCGIVYCPDALIRHPARGSFAELAKKRRRLVGGAHLEELKGTRPKRALLSYLSFLTYNEVHRTMSRPGLTEVQRIQILWVCFCLGAVAFTEILRLRYLSGKPNRS